MSTHLYVSDRHETTEILIKVTLNIYNITSTKYMYIVFFKNNEYLMIVRNFCLVHEEITSTRLYTPCNPRNGLRKGVYNLIEVISNEPNK